MAATRELTVKASIDWGDIREQVESFREAIAELARLYAASMDRLRALHYFIEDGGEPWEIEEIEAAYLGQPIDVAEAIREAESGLI